MSLSELQDAKEQIRQAVDIVDLVGSYVALRRQGRGYVALCPWHDDSRPSLQVNPERQSFKCWVCDIGGDIFSFLMRMEGLEFRESLEMLADRAGITLAPSKQQGDVPSQFDRRNLLRAMAWAEKQYCECLLQADEAEPARRYLAERGISLKSIEQFHLGFAPVSWDFLLQRAIQAGSSPAVLERVGLVSPRQSGEGYYDRFRGRLMFSIRDVRSRPIAFGGRVLPGVGESDPDRPEAKYINSPETPLFNKSSQLYALDLARAGIAHEQNIVVMEGYTDVIMAHQHGITNAVAVLGTALGERHVPLVRRFTDSVTLVLDGDEAGQRRTMQIIDRMLALHLKNPIEFRILTLPDGADPCDVIATQGRDAFQHLLSNSLDPLEYKKQAVTKGLASAPGTHQVAQAVEEMIAAMAHALPTPSQVGSEAYLRQQEVLTRLGHDFGLTEEVLRTRLVSKRKELSARNRFQSATKPASEPPRSARGLTITAWERELLELLLHQPEFLPRLAEVLAPEEIPSDVCRTFYVLALEAMHAGQIPSFEQLMLATNDPDAQNLLVDCDEHGREKLTSDTDQRVRDLIDQVHENRLKEQQNEQKIVFHKKTLEPQKEDEEIGLFFKELAKKQAKHRQAGSAPTDG